MSNQVNLNPIKGLEDARSIFIEFCEKASANRINWTTSEFNDYIEIIKGEVANAYKRAYKVNDCLGCYPESKVHKNTFKVLDLVNELHNTIENTLLNRINTANDDELNEFINELINNQQKLHNLVAGDTYRIIAIEHDFKEYFEFLYYLTELHEKFTSYEGKRFDILKSTVMEDENIPKDPYEESEKKFLEEMFRKALSKMPYIGKIRFDVWKFQKSIKRETGKEISKKAAIRKVINELLSKKYWHNPTRLDISETLLIDKIISDKEEERAHSSVIDFLMQTVEVLEGESDINLYDNSMHFPSKYDYEKIMNMKELELYYHIHKLPSSFSIPKEGFKTALNNASVLLHDIKDSIEQLENLKELSTDIKREELIKYIKYEWSELKYKSSEEYSKQYGYSKQDYGRAFAPFYSETYWCMPKLYTKLLAQELEILSKIEVDSEILKEIANEQNKSEPKQR